jgi:hypothetical protein
MTDMEGELYLQTLGRWTVWDATTGLAVADFPTEKDAQEYVDKVGDENLTVSHYGIADAGVHSPGVPDADV